MNHFIITFIFKLCSSPNGRVEGPVNLEKWLNLVLCLVAGNDGAFLQDLQIEPTPTRAPPPDIIESHQPPNNVVSKYNLLPKTVA